MTEQSNEIAGVDLQAIADALAAPFEAHEVKFKPQTVSGSRALALPYVDARVIQDRLDDVLGVMGWQDSYECLPDGAVICRLRIRLGTEWITKEDVGGQSEQPDEGDRRKASFSDALKRAAVKFGVGRYIYRLKPQWVDYDAQKRRFTQQPTLPDSALPKPRYQEEAPRRTAQPEAAAPAPAKKEKQKPTPESLQKYEAEMLVPKGLSEPGEFVAYAMLQLPPEPADWQSDTARQCCKDWADSRVVNPQEVASLELEMKKRADVTWPRVVDSLRAWGERSGVEVPVGGLKPETLTVRLWAKAMSQLAQMPLIAAPAAAAEEKPQKAARSKAKAS
jgi:hypothetical protein